MRGLVSARTNRTPLPLDPLRRKPVGGAILVRSPSGVISETLVVLQSSGAKGGAEPLCLGCQGAPGRIRVDVPSPALLSSSAEYGPMWAVENPSIVTNPIVEFNVWAGTDGTYGISVNRGAMKTFSISGGIVINETTVSVSLDAGANELCVTAVTSAEFSQSEAWNCISVAYVPR